MWTGSRQLYGPLLRRPAPTTSRTGHAKCHPWRAGVRMRSWHMTAWKLVYFVHLWEASFQPSPSWRRETIGIFSLFIPDEHSRYTIPHLDSWHASSGGNDRCHIEQPVIVTLTKNSIWFASERLAVTGVHGLVDVITSKSETDRFGQKLVL
jgi:hypothetical protein